VFRPNEEKIYVFCYIQITETSQVVNQWFGRTVIYSDQRFAYEEAQYIIETKDDTIQKKFRLLELHIKFQQKLLLQR
jgi:ribonuclease R